MINILGLSLIAITLGTSFILCPNPDKTQDEAHRAAIVVEFHKPNGGGGGNTKVSISPQESAQKSRQENARAHVSSGAKEKIFEKAEQVKQRFKDAASVLPNVGQGISAYSGPSEVVSDGLKGSLGRAKEAVAEKAHEAMRREEEVKERAKEAVGEAEEAAKMAADKVKGAAKDMADTTKRIKGDVQRNAYTRMKDTKEKVTEKAKEAGEMMGEGAHRLKDSGKKELKEILGRGREVVYDIFDYFFSPENLNPVFGMVHLLGLATAYGMCVWVTFISSYVLAMALPRQQFATMQTKLYPVYFKAMGYSIGTAFSGHFLSQRRWPYSDAGEAFLGFNLLAPLLMVLVNLLYLEPRSTKVMFERMKMEKEEGRGMNPEMMRLGHRLKNLNSQSSFLNVLTLTALTLHLAQLAQRLYIVC